MFTQYGKNQMLTGISAGAATYMSLHSAFSSTGSNEVSTAGGTYGRKAITWGTPASGSLNFVSIAGSSFNLPAGATTAFAGIWTDPTSTASTAFLGMWPIGGTPFEFYMTGLDSYLYIDSHTFSNDDQAVVMGTTAGGGLTAGTIYYVVGSATGKIQLASTQGGSPIVLTSTAPSADAYVCKILPDTYASGGTFTPSTLTIALPW